MIKQRLISLKNFTHNKNQGLLKHSTQDTSDEHTQQQQKKMDNNKTDTKSPTVQKKICMRKKKE